MRDGTKESKDWKRKYSMLVQGGGGAAGGNVLLQGAGLAAAGGEGGDAPNEQQLTMADLEGLGDTLMKALQRNQQAKKRRRVYDKQQAEAR